MRRRISQSEKQRRADQRRQSQAENRKRAEDNQARRAEQRKHALAARGRLLHDRQSAAFLLSCSISNLIRFEKAGRLIPIKPSGSPIGKTFYSAENIEAVASGAR